MVGHRQPKLTKRGVILFNIYVNVQRVTYLPLTYLLLHAKCDLRPAAYGGVVLQRFEFIKVCEWKKVTGSHLDSEIMLLGPAMDTFEARGECLANKLNPDQGNGA